MKKTKKDWRIELELLIIKEAKCLQDAAKNRCYMAKIYRFIEKEAIWDIIKEYAKMK